MHHCYECTVPAGPSVSEGRWNRHVCVRSTLASAWALRLPFPVSMCINSWLCTYPARALAKYMSCFHYMHTNYMYVCIASISFGSVISKSKVMLTVALSDSFLGIIVLLSCTLAWVRAHVPLNRSTLRGLQCTCAY